MVATLDGLGSVVRPARDGDAVGGVPARFVAMPASTEQAAAVVRATASAGLAVVVRGGGTKLDWGVPPRRLDLVVDTRRLTGVVEHAAGDLITVVRSGTTLAELRERLAVSGQHLAVDDPLHGATVGGTVAVNASGPRRLLYGTARDLLIGITVVRPDGVVAHAGGKVVKNVAGYDLGKLFTGSYGTLGLITRAAFRLHPVPAAGTVVTRRAPDAAEAGRWVAAVRAAQVVPSAVEVDAPPGGEVQVAVLVEGTPAGVRARAETLRRLLSGTVLEGLPAWWGEYPWAATGTGLKLTSALSAVPRLLAAARDAGERHGVAVAVRGSAGTGVLYAGLPGAADPRAVAHVVADLRAAARQAEGHAIVLTAPGPVRDRVDMWGPIEALGLMRRVKDRFDPGGRFAPGRFVGGI